MKKIVSIIAFGLALALVGCGQGDKAAQPPSSAKMSENGGVEVLRVGFPPDEKPDEIIRKNKPLLEYLRKATGVPKVEIIVPENYTAAVEQMALGKLDLVYFGGLTYVLAKRDVDVTPIVRGAKGGTTDNFTFIIVRNDSGIKTLEDLKGRTFAFGDVASTSGHLMPHQGLLQMGINPKTDFKKLVYTGAHDKTAMAVYEGMVEAGAMSSRMLPNLIEQGKIKGEDIRIIWKSEPFADYPWAARTSLGSKLIGKLADVFILLDDPEMLKLLKVEGYEKTTDADFEGIRKAAYALGFMGD